MRACVKGGIAKPTYEPVFHFVYVLRGGGEREVGGAFRDGTAWGAIARMGIQSGAIVGD